MSFSDFVYLDNAATSYPKPDCVFDAVDDYNRTNGRPVGRGATDACSAVQQIVDRCRFRAAELLGATAREQIVFTFNCTDSLNMILHGLLATGDHVVTTTAEHNSVLRPLRALERSRSIDLTRVDVDEAGFVEAGAVCEAIRPDTRLVIVQHAGNVTGAIQPIEEISEAVRDSNALLAIDAAQTAGHLPFSISELQPDFLACSGHKGLLGPLGTGLLYVAPGRESDLEPLRQGGTGSRSELDVQPDVMPDRFESGNHNAPGLIGLDAALGFLLETGIDQVREHEQQLAARLIDGIRSIESLTVHSAEDRSRHTAVVSVSSELYSADELAALLTQHFQVDTRAGLHCAPGMHRRLGTTDRQGTVRFSVRFHNANDDIDRAVDALKQVSQFA